MGLLDDAIREHLELKRRRGGDPAEIARAEQEALGPVRREAAPAAEAPHEHAGDADRGAPAGHDEPPAAHSETLAAAHDFDDEPSRPPAPPEEQTRIIAPDERPAAPAAHDEPAHRHVPEQHLAAPADKLPPGADAFDEPHRPAVPEQHIAAPADRLPPREEQPAPPAAPPADDPRHSDVVDQPTTEYRVEDHHDEPASHGDEDVLEETPDFLQETPEHDRLWFEQRPPRDFDFDD